MTINENFVDGQEKGSILVCDNPMPVVALSGREAAEPQQEGTDATQPILMMAFLNLAHGEATIQCPVPRTVETAPEVYHTRGDNVKTLFNGVAEGGKTYEVKPTPDDQIVPGACIYRPQAGMRTQVQSLGHAQAMKRHGFPNEKSLIYIHPQGSFNKPRQPQS